MPQRRRGLFHLQGLVWLPGFWLVVTSRALSSSSMFSDQFCLVIPPQHTKIPQPRLMRLCSLLHLSAGKRKRSQSNSSAEDVDQSPPEAVKKSSKKKTKSKQRKSKHSNLEFEADFSLGSEAEAEAEKRGRAKGGKKKSKAPTIPKKANVPPPAPSAVKPDHARSHQSKEIAAEKDGQRKALLWSKYAPAFRLDISLEKLFALRTNNRNELDKYAEYCDGPLHSTPVLPFSAKYYDSEEKLVVALFASRLDEPETIAEYNATHPCPLSAQYAGHTEEDLIAAQKREHLSQNLLEGCSVALQSAAALCSY
ncbi:hypothetical protein LXA43DRAFT_1066617 [Ganoderma leucocontextum]|nr:hypothetical protein LXA43DRAFT_1066617 [Ganoderma leucocontextum]